MKQKDNMIAYQPLPKEQHVNVVTNLADENSVDVVTVSEKPAKKKKRISFADEIFQGMGLDQEAQDRLKQECNPEPKPTAQVEAYKNPYLGGRYI